jgi:hypothetical protein
MKKQFSTLQANHATQGDFSSTGYDVPGLGVSIYVGGAAADIEIITVGGDTVLYTSVPQGTFMQTPLFSEISATNTTQTDMVVSYLAPPYR